MRHVAGAPLPLRLDTVRRTWAATPVHAEGLLVCPTNAGVVAAFDPETGATRWVHSYAAVADRPARPPEATPESRASFLRAEAAGWKVTPPAVADGKVVFAPPEASTLRCLDLRDGRLLWEKKRRADDAYLAGVFGGRVVVVGNRSVRALGLDKGEKMWTLATGEPSGRGAARGDLYYLPLRESAAGKRPEVCVLDIARGVVVDHLRLRRAGGSLTEDIPGNLLFSGDALISQGVDELAVYPRPATK